MGKEGDGRALSLDSFPSTVRCVFTLLQVSLFMFSTSPVNTLFYKVGSIGHSNLISMEEERLLRPHSPTIEELRASEVMFRRACSDFLKLALVFIGFVLFLAWGVVTTYNNEHNYQSHAIKTNKIGRRDIPNSESEAAHNRAVQEAFKARFRNIWCNGGRKLLDVEFRTPDTLNSLDFSHSDTNAHDYPNPGPSPTPDSHDYPPPAWWSETKPDVHTDYAPVGPHPSPDYHDYPPPASFTQV